MSTMSTIPTRNTVSTIPTRTTISTIPTRNIMSTIAVENTLQTCSLWWQLCELFAYSATERRDFVYRCHVLSRF